MVMEASRNGMGMRTACVHAHMHVHACVCAHMCMCVHSIGAKAAGKTLVFVMVGQGLGCVLSSSCTILYLQKQVPTLTHSRYSIYFH